MSADGFYRAFEDRHRGPATMVRERLGAYLPLVNAVASGLQGAPVVDLGCGRGEWLALLRDTGIAAHGADVDEGMLAACAAEGLPAERADAIEFLARQADRSHSVITAFHVVEHLPFDRVHELVEHALRVLKPGGLLILETPNPENLVTGATHFHMDPTHLKPLPPQLLEFVPLFHGFERSTVWRLHEHPSVRQGDLALVDVLGGVSPDYAVIAQKRMLSGFSPDRAALVEGAFSARVGVTLTDLAVRHEEQSRRDVDGLSQAVRRLEAQVEAMASSHESLVQSRLQLDAILASRSWQVTRPLRWATAQWRALREFGPAHRLRAAGRMLARSVGLGRPAADAPEPLHVPDGLTPREEEHFIRLHAAMRNGPVRKD